MPDVKQPSPAAQGVIFGAIVVLLLVVLEKIAAYFALPGVLRLIDNIAGGVIAGLIAYWQARNRNRFLEQRLRIIALMNHHVRNALQVITYSHYLKPDEKQVTEVKEAIERIEWALREVLPASSLDEVGSSVNGSANITERSTAKQR